MKTSDHILTLVLPVIILCGVLLAQDDIKPFRGDEKPVVKTTNTTYATNPGMRAADPRKSAIKTIVNDVFETYPIQKKVAVSKTNAQGEWEVKETTRIWESVEDMVTSAATQGFDLGLAYGRKGIVDPVQEKLGIVPSWVRTTPSVFPPHSISGAIVGDWSLAGPSTSIEAAFTMNRDPELNRTDSRIIAKGIGRQLPDVDWEMSLAYDKANNRHFARARIRVEGVTTTIQSKVSNIQRGRRYVMRLEWNHKRKKVRLLVNEMAVASKVIDGEYKAGSTRPVTIGATVDTNVPVGFSAQFEGTIHHVIAKSLGS